MLVASAQREHACPYIVGSPPVKIMTTVSIAAIAPETAAPWHFWFSNRNTTRTARTRDLISKTIRLSLR